MVKHGDYVGVKELAEVVKQEPRTGHWSEVVTDTRYEKGLKINFGIDKNVVGSRRICMGRTIIPPHTCNERHVHMYAEASMYIVQGPMVLLLGPEAKKIVCPTGTFVYAPEGVIHGVANPTRDHDVELVFSYGGVGTKEEAGIVFVKDTPESYPPKDWDVID